MTGNKRTSTKHPAHINASKLPDRVYYKADGKGCWMLSYYDEFGKRHAKRLCGSKATLADIWKAAEAQEEKKQNTFASLSTEFMQTRIWKKLEISTQKDYEKCHQVICNTQTTGGKMGDIPIKKWSKGLIRQYHDKRAETSESRANKELAYIKRIYSWAFEYEKIPENTAAGIKKIPIAPRQHYAEDTDYYFFLNVAKESGYWYAQYSIELAYLCRMRMCEVLDLTDANELENGLIIHRRKGSKTNITEWQPRLKAIWDALKQTRNKILSARKQPHPIKSDQRWLFISERTGDKLQIEGLRTAIQRINEQAKEKAKNQGITFNGFTFHDLKRKGISDTEGDKMKASGHRSHAMMKVYDVTPDVVKPTKSG